MKAKQIAITSGAACGTLVTRVESNSGKLLGFIRVVNVDFTAVLCIHTLYIAQQIGRKYKAKLCSTLAEAYQYLGVSIQELDRSDLGKYCFDEHIPSAYWKEEYPDPVPVDQEWEDNGLPF